MHLFCTDGDLTVRYGVNEQAEWLRCVKVGLFSDEWWRPNLRMLETYHAICNKLRLYIQCQSTRFWEPINVEIRVALTIWRQATNIEYRTTAAVWVRSSTAGETVFDTCETITHHLTEDTCM